MVVKKYISTGFELDQSAPDYSHEVSSVINIIKNLFSAFNHENNLYAIIANLKEIDASADLVIITRRGIGVVELKGNFGRISQNHRDNCWYSNQHLIKAGNNNKYGNPHKQVQSYAREIRRILMEKGDSYLDNEPPGWEKLQFNTAVCFTNKDTDFGKFREWYYRKREYLEDWEKFAILSPEEVSDWAASLRFELSKGYQYNYEPFSLSNREIENLATDLFSMVEWTEIDKLMPGEKPYAYLSIVGTEQTESHGLKLEKEIIGRNPETCHFVIPNCYDAVSGEHIIITRTIEGIFMEDTSKNGTYVNGNRLCEKVLLNDNQNIHLGGEGSEKVCTLTFSFTPPHTPITASYRYPL